MPPEKHGDVMKPDHEFKEEVKTIVAESVRQTLMQLGIASNDPIEMQKDMQHLREWRQTMDSVKSKGLLTVLTMFLTGIAAAFWLGFRELIQK
jgi:hypothetical protein